MSIGSILYQLFLSPLILIFEAVYEFSYIILQSAGAAIFPLSLVVNLLLLPFYNRAEAIQSEERDREQKMAPFVEHIKKTFKGDERYMMLQSFYKENNYKPIYALRSSIALILEVPFFFAAYTFLSDLPSLQRCSFWIIDDLSQPDRLLSFGGFTLNALPTLMTLINIISSEIYTKGLKFKDKITLHGMALIFLVLLYNSPSGLVLYWTLNNVFSLMKNIVYKSSNKRRATGICFAIIGVLIMLFGFFSHGIIYNKLSIILIGLIFLFPLLFHSSDTPKKKQVSSPADNKLFLFGALFLSIFLGALIPSFVIVASPSEFVLINSVHSPVRYIIYALLTAAGAFVIWGGLFYYLAGQKSRKRAIVVIWCFAFISALNFLRFGNSDSILTSDLKYDGKYSIPLKPILLNLALVTITIALVVLLFKKRIGIIRFLAPVFIVAATVISGYNIYKINKEMTNIRWLAEHPDERIPSMEFSRSGKNVVVIMIDRAVSSFIPYIFQENPVLINQFSGFVWYPNTLSFGMRTVVAAPAIYGGYDYMPDRINDRSSELLVDKHDEALLTMPVLFSESGYEVTVFDPPFAGYGFYPDLSIYDPYPEIKAYNTEIGMFRNTDNDDDIIKNWKRNFFCFSLMKSSPLFLQPVLYTNGTYFSPGNEGYSLQLGDDYAHFLVSPAAYTLFSNSYNALNAYPSLTTIDDSSDNHFFLLQNGTAHNTIPLQEPEYEPRIEVNNSEYDMTHEDRFIYNGQQLRINNQDQLTHYQCNMAAWLQLGKWMDYLKELGVYDNTRIIIVSDHGWPIGSRDDMFFLDGAKNNAMYNSKDSMAYNPVLFVKDFGASGVYTTDYTFMTNADTPYLAMQGLIEDPENPFTGRPVFQQDAKNSDELYVMYTDNWDLHLDDTRFDAAGVNIWYSLRNQDIFTMSNWAQEDEEP